MKYFIKTFGCQQNYADSERLATIYEDQGYKKSKDYTNADLIIINTCMVRESAENRVYGLINNLAKENKPNRKIILTGCLAGLAKKDQTGKFLKRLKEKLPVVTDFLAPDEINSSINPLRLNKRLSLVPISQGCNNFCTYCVVPLAKGREISRPFFEIIKECNALKNKGYQEIMLLGQNVNSYGSDFFKNKDNLEAKKMKPVYVKHLGRYRLPTLFPQLLEAIAKLGFIKTDFLSSNPWDFSKELIEVIINNKNITRTIHLPLQSGSTRILKLMNRWYTSSEYLKLATSLKQKVKNLKLTTDIIVGFPNETESDFNKTVAVCKKVGFIKAYVSRYSARPFTRATKTMTDNVSPAEKKRRWLILDKLINHKQKTSTV